MFGYNRKATKTKSNKKESNAKKLDEYALALFKMRHEKDPIKAAKMNMRLAQGIYDFSDL